MIDQFEKSLHLKNIDFPIHEQGYIHHHLFRTVIYSHSKVYSFQCEHFPHLLLNLSVNIIYFGALIQGIFKVLNF